MSPLGSTLPLLSWSPFHFDPGTLFWTWVVFAIVVFILAKAAWRPLLASLEEREKRMAEGIERAARAEAEARRAAEETGRKLQEAYAKADAIVAETRARGEALSKELSAQARAEAEKLLAHARDEIALAKQQAAEELRVQAVDLALEVAGAVLQRNVGSEDNQRLARQAIDLMQGGGGKA